MTLTPFNIYNFTDKLTIPSQYSLRSKAFTNKKQKDRDIRALSSKLSKILAFGISKDHFINFNNSFYNTPNIKSSIFTFISLK